MENVNKKIDALLKIRQEGMYNYSKCTRELIDMGVKIGHKNTGDLTIPGVFEPYLEKYNKSNMEFEWEVMDKDGTVLKQFDGDVQHSFKDIKLDSMQSIAFISNFNWPTDNKEHSVIVRLNWETGLFELMNGFAPAEVREELCSKKIDGDIDISFKRKLILFTRKRFSSTYGEVNEKYPEFFPMKDEFLYYNRFVIGYEIPGTIRKKIAIIDPTGIISLFEK